MSTTVTLPGDFVPGDIILSSSTGTVYEVLGVDPDDREALRAYNVSRGRTMRGVSVSPMSRITLRHEKWPTDYRCGDSGLKYEDFPCEVCGVGVGEQCVEAFGHDSSLRKLGRPRSNAQRRHPAVYSASSRGRGAPPEMAN